MPAFIPVGLERDDQRQLVVRWNDGAVHRISAATLRSACPCAACREQQAEAARAAQRGELPILGTTAGEPVQIEQMMPVGNYAYQIRFSDGHATGLFTFELLRTLGQQSQPRGEGRGGAAGP